MSCVPRDMVVVRVGVVGQGVGVRAALERHGAPHGRRLHPPKDASSDLRRARAAPDRPPYGGHRPGRASLHQERPTHP